MKIMKCWLKGSWSWDSAPSNARERPQCSASGSAGGTCMKHINIFCSITKLNFSEARRGSSRLWEPKALNFSCLICLLARTALLSHLEGIWSVGDSFPGSLSAPARCFRAESHPCISPVTVPCYQPLFSLLGCSRPLICSRIAATAFLVFFFNASLHSAGPSALPKCCNLCCPHAALTSSSRLFLESMK